MSDVFITSDEHYGHEKIIEYTHRPFKSVEEQTETLIAKHNAKVPNNENVTTIHVGDMFWHTLSMDDAEYILDRLHGRHAFIFGNHDELIENNREFFNWRFKWMKGEDKTSGVHMMNFNNHKITLCHYAMHVWHQSHKGSWMLFGHSHNELHPVGKTFDIGVDAHNFEPWSMEEIEAEMAKRPLGHVIPKDKIWIRMDEPKISNTTAGSTVHLPGCECGWCRIGDTKA